MFYFVDLRPQCEPREPILFDFFLDVGFCAGRLALFWGEQSVVASPSDKRRRAFFLVAATVQWGQTSAAMKIPAQIASLRAVGYKIRITHFRVTQHGTFSNLQIKTDNAKISALAQASLSVVAKHIISPFGGRAECEIEAPDGRRSTGEAICSPLDNFRRHTATAKAFGRAWQELLNRQPE